MFGRPLRYDIFVRYYFATYDKEHDPACLFLVLSSPTNARSVRPAMIRLFLHDDSCVRALVILFVCVSVTPSKNLEGRKSSIVPW